MSYALLKEKLALLQSAEIAEMSLSFAGVRQTLSLDFTWATYREAEGHNVRVVLSEIYYVNIVSDPAVKELFLLDRVCLEEVTHGNSQRLGELSSYDGRTREANFPKDKPLLYLTISGTVALEIVCAGCAVYERVL